MTTVLKYNLFTRLKNIISKGNKSIVEIATPVKLYRSIHELPMMIFIDCFCDSIYDKLILQGKATVEELNDAWTDIMQQYTELIGGSEVKVKLYNIKQLARLESKLIRIDSLLKTISIKPHEQLFSMLYEFGYSLPKKDYTPSNLDTVLKIFIGHYRLDKTKYKMMTEGFIAKSKTEHTTDRNEFTKNLIKVSVAFKMPAISITSITVAQYCNYMIEYADYCDSLEKQNQKHK